MSESGCEGCEEVEEGEEGDGLWTRGGGQADEDGLFSFGEPAIELPHEVLYSVGEGLKSWEGRGREARVGEVGLGESRLSESS